MKSPGQEPQIGDRFLTHSFVRKRPKERLILEVCKYMPEAECWKVVAWSDRRYQTQVYFLKRQKKCAVPFKIITWEIKILA
jgi:hypothetical protein